MLTPASIGGRDARRLLPRVYALKRRNDANCMRLACIERRIVRRSAFSIPDR
ncbi:hypothetical protein IS481_01465 [Caldimonas thermodepolymerans]|jgi:hypothetical protein|uniref:Uncharacterized protein n=1 Tax=Caldimonas thermodepolymerans TaxID=215580 RepID=A0AA46DBF6_9BURK|nr:hypothetical protein [Caldimonas thermodepolymerans]QPC31883.1 hypothetical protein IS481_01465 [Caldimonas thermodepolymerans]RDI01603.1 hypothetical protein DES46_103166 [Caldimonas thermodepolymerans]TCP04949.1 hypothetical protein EV676_10935 [Caldimonas thermodepolymerans]UZG44670.1 hypothetical protein ONZ46_01625 [Caldimonas thermodepolymerans]UZG48323.1 hypothetical protein ONS87_01525 [Caldimonas thermodepolymerans]